jgi:hypothetical protein
MKPHRFYIHWKKAAYGAFFGRAVFSGGKKRGFCRLPVRVATP